MIGLSLALLWVAWKFALNGMPIEAAFLVAADWLNTWYWVWGIGLGALMALPLFGVTIAGTVAGAAIPQSGIGEVLGGLGGLALSGGLSALAFIVFFARCGLLIGGTYFLMNAGRVGMPFSEFNTRYLVLGGVMLVLGIIMSRSSSSSNS